MSDDVGAADTIRERSGQSTIKLWLLMAVNRLIITAALGLTIFFAFVGLVSILEPPLIPQLQSSDPIETLFTTMLSAVALVTTLTVTIGQVVLTQENGPLGDQHMRMSNAMDVRSYVGEIIGKPSPANPSTFLLELIIACEERAHTLQNNISGASDQQLQDDVDELTNSIIENAETVKEDLTEVSFGTFDMLSAGLGFNYGQKIYEIEQLTNKYADGFDETERRDVDELKTALSMYAPAREHVKTLYFQWELTNLSRQILYLSIPSLLIAGVMVIVVEPASFPGNTFGVDDILWIIAGAFTFTLLPFFLLVSYVLRLVSIAQQTLAVEPLIIRESEQ